MNKKARMDNGEYSIEKSDDEIDFKLSLTNFPILSLTKGSLSEKTKLVAEEVPIALSYDGTTQAVLMASPDDLEDFAFGFSLTEGLINSPEEIERISIVNVPRGIDIQISLNVDRRDAFRKRRRNMAGPVGCGLCGIESIDAAMRDIPRVQSDMTFSNADVCEAARVICQMQTLNNLTRSAHAAAFYTKEAGVQFVREDVGRHNALDKLCGHLFRNHINVTDGLIVVTSRLSMEMVQKAAMLGVSSLAAVSAATAEAIRIGEQSNMTLIGRVRDKDFEIYCGAQRILNATA